ncbi:2Fe-2S iron-sulfur cluster binding domain-containing protein [Bradyrhizobium sp. NP1]|uniref:2Fe-2S iron-sulfur cluster binding domain-containing protein n=1 Tax=Bradyrhizobium sp. NP1 TaxID=3049772 RepID=UPI0025A5EC01|nr:2Fe-2S iron-sulfur cluster binding domain-containing protein [Bradyrhizobium sp. NP1]WJR75863.1 2Fe-2S iron-sulfur cluster binding domain-containing protein [Bradyrhizobium sp. NP1]
MIPIEVVDRGGRRATFVVEEGQRLLHAGLMAGIGLPHECATGTCGNCKASVVAGDALHLWPAAPGAKVCRRPGDVLLCQTAARSPLELALPSAFIPPCQPSCSRKRGRLVSTHMLTPEVGLFEVELSEPVAYKPGQFVLLSGLGVREPRAYSMTHHEPEETRLRFLIRRSPGGGFTTRLFEASSGDEVDVFGPLGRATFDCDERRPFVGVAGGSGIAGIMSIIRHSLERDHFREHPSRLFFGLRDADGSYLLDDLADIVERSGTRLRVTIVFSDAQCSPGLAAKTPLLDFRQGFVHDVARECLLKGEMPELRDKHPPVFFVGGPPLMVNATMRALISDCKISPTEIRYDRFG